MASHRNGRQQILSRPLFTKAVDEGRSPTDKLCRVTSPALLSPYRKSATYNSRIDKHPANSRKRPGRASSPDLDLQFADAIEDTRKEIRKAADDVLTAVERDASAEVAQVAKDFGQKLQLAIDYETRAFQSIADERLLVTTHSSEDEILTKQEFVFGERMKEFEHIVENEEVAIEALWQKWEKVRVETVCLAFEVLGPGQVVLEEEELEQSAIVQEKAIGAVQCHSQHEDALKTTSEEIAAIQSSAKRVTSQTLRILKDQQQELSAANKAAMNSMTKMLQDLNA